MSATPTQPLWLASIKGIIGLQRMSSGARIQDSPSHSAQVKTGVGECVCSVGSSQGPTEPERHKDVSSRINGSPSYSNFLDQRKKLENTSGHALFASFLE